MRKNNRKTTHVLDMYVSKKSLQNQHYKPLFLDTHPCLLGACFARSVSRPASAESALRAVYGGLQLELLKMLCAQHCCLAACKC